MQFTRNTPVQGLLTVDKLHSDQTATSIGCWPVPAIVHDKQVDLMIVESKDGSYMLAGTANISVLARADSLKKIVNSYNNLVALARAHDISIVLRTNKKYDASVGIG